MEITPSTGGQVFASTAPSDRIMSIPNQNTDRCFCSGPDKRGHYGRGLSLGESLESLTSLDSLESPEMNGQILLYFPQSGGSLKSLESLNSLESLENDFSEKTPFPKDPIFPKPICECKSLVGQTLGCRSDTPPPPPRPLSHLSLCHCGGVSRVHGPPKTCRAPEGGAATV